MTPGPAGGLTRDSVLDNIMLHWLTNTAAPAARMYWESTLKVYPNLNELRAAFQSLRWSTAVRPIEDQGVAVGLCWPALAREVTSPATLPSRASAETVSAGAWLPHCGWLLA